jgi:integrase
MSPRIQHGSIVKKSGVFYGHYSSWSPNPDDPTKPIRHQHSFRIGPCDMPKSSARRILARRIEQELHLRGDRRMTVQAFIENHWIPQRQSDWRESTRVTNLYLLKLITEKFGAQPLEDIDVVQLQTYIDGLAKTRSKSLTHHVRIFLRSIFETAVDDDFLQKSPARKLRVPKNLRPVLKPFLTVSQVQALLAAAQGADRVLLAVGFSTGLRPSELLALQWRHFDPAGQKLQIVQSLWNGKLAARTKTTDADSDPNLQRVFLPQSVCAALTEWRAVSEYTDPADFIFPGMYGGAQWRGEVARRIQALATACGIPALDFRMIRRTVATLAAGCGSPRDIQTMLRHRKPETAALHYTQGQETETRAAVDRLDRLLKG